MPTSRKRKQTKKQKPRTRTRQQQPDRDEEDCHDAGLGAADYSFLNEYYFIGWIRANPREVADSEIAMLVLDKLDEGPDSRGEGAALKSILQEMLALPAPIEPPESWIDDGEDDKEAES